MLLFRQISIKKNYIKMFKEIYDMMIKTKVNDVHRTISTEDEYLEYSKILANEDEEEIDNFLFEKARELTQMDEVKEKIDKILNKDEENDEKDSDEDINEDELKLDEVVIEEETDNENKENEDVVEEVVEQKPKRRVGRPKKEEVAKEKRRVGRPRKNK